MCVCRGTGSRNGVEGRGLELRVEGWRMYELESEYEITRRRYSSLLVITRLRYSSLLVVVITHCRHYIIQCNTYLYSIIHSI